MYKKGVIGQLPALMTSFIVVSIIIASLIVSSLFIAQPKANNIMAYTDSILDRKIVVSENNVESEMTILEGVMKYQKKINKNPTFVNDGDYGFEEVFSEAVVDFLKKENTDYLPEDSKRKKVCLVLGVKQKEISRVLIVVKGDNGNAVESYNAKSMVDLDKANMGTHYGIEELPRIYLKVDRKELNIYSYLGRCSGGSL